MIGGGVGALIYPIVFYVVTGVSILQRDSFLLCLVLEDERLKKQSGYTEPLSNNVRTVMFSSLLLMASYITIYFFLFAGVNTSRNYPLLVILFTLLNVVGVIAPLVGLFLLGETSCSSEGVGVATVISSLLIVVISVVTLVVSFIVLTRSTRAGGA